MSQLSFDLKSPVLKALTPDLVRGMDDDAAERALIMLRWPNGVTCPRCGHMDPYRITKRRIWRCRSKTCWTQFSITSMTYISSRKMPLRQYILAMVLFANDREGGGPTLFEKELNVDYHTSLNLFSAMKDEAASLCKSATEVRWAMAHE